MGLLRSVGRPEFGPENALINISNLRPILILGVLESGTAISHRIGWRVINANWKSTVVISRSIYFIILNMVVEDQQPKYCGQWSSTTTIMWSSLLNSYKTRQATLYPYAFSRGSLTRPQYQVTIPFTVQPINIDRGLTYSIPAIKKRSRNNRGVCCSGDSEKGDEDQRSSRKEKNQIQKMRKP